MSPTRSAFLACLLLAAACRPTPPDAREGGGGDSAAEAEVRAASLALVAAMNAHEPDSILGFYSLDDGFTYVGCTNFVFAGETFTTILRGYHLSNPEIRYDLSVQALRFPAPDIAVVALQGTWSPDVPLFTTRVLRREQDGRWLVVWEHESWPGCSAPSAPHPGTAPGDTVASAAAPVP